MKLRWEPQGNGSFYGYSGDLRVAMIVRRQTETGGTEFFYQVDAVHTKWITKGYGECRSEAPAKRSVERAWNAWLDRAGLIPLPGAGLGLAKDGE